MPDSRKIGLIGGDKRQLVTAACLSADFECAIWGFAGVYGTPDERYLKDSVRCTDWESAVKCSEAVVLPLPVTRDTGAADALTLNAPLAYPGEGGVVHLTDVCDRLQRGSFLLGGMIPPVLKRYAAERGITVCDYYDSEQLQIKNAVPTAEGAIAACMEVMPVTIAGMRAAVFGYGRVGRTLAQKLLALGADVFAVARSEKDLAWAQCDGCIAVPLGEYRELPVRCEAVFNTVPHCIFDRNMLSALEKETVIFELSSSNAGTDITAAAECGIRVVPLPSLPGKTAPVTAGEIICTVIRDALRTKMRKE
ncbi:MAG: hypothetical protein IJC71_06410 [Clostridia bacterium]|nr:hypothetical protein [Clostridia bacterium]